MIVKSLKSRILFSFLIVITAMTLSIATLGYFIISHDIIDKTQKRVDNNIKAARAFLNAEISSIGQAMELITFEGNLEKLKNKIPLDYAQTITTEQALAHPSEIVKTAALTQKPAGAIRIIAAEELENMAPQLQARAVISLIPTNMSTPTKKKVLTGAMTKEYALPVISTDGKTKLILYGGRIINQDYKLVDRVKDLVFGNELYKDKPVGTVTIFQNDTRIATNVRNKDGQRAIGTRVSSEVYHKVVENGREWQDRAFVVTDWYRTAYEPIRNIDGKIIGILYVGILEKPFQDMAKNAMLMFMAIVIAASAVAIFLAFLLAGAVTKPITDLLAATKELSDGNLGHTVKIKTNLTELDRLTKAFNEMSTRLDEREKSLSVTNEKLEASNKSYIDLIGFVSHELKGILASAVMNIYSVRDGFLGLINFKQKKAIDSVARNLDYLTATVKKFLNLGRIEKGEISVHKSSIAIKKEIFDIAIDSLATTADRKKLNIKNNIPAELTVYADYDLMQVVANNLITNAIKYTPESGNIILTGRTNEKTASIEVYNDSEPFSSEQADKLFKKFSRLNRTDTKRVKGTGLGLYITRQIIVSHGGKIVAEPKQQGNSFIFDIERNIDNGNTA